MRQELEEPRREHRCFEYLLDILERQLMAEIMDDLTCYPDVCHHT